MVPIAVVLLSFSVDRVRARGQVLRGVTVGGIAARAMGQEAPRAQLAEVGARRAAAKSAMRFEKRG
ncbi:MAG TPA: hypothetical protein PKD61_35110, partial [Polyangiaceae bacterium]|nr:hypothetical protein [Polyangiaceae bacterium]